MEQKRILLIGRTDSVSAHRLFEEARNAGVFMEGISSRSFSFDGKRIEVAPDSLTYDVMEYDVYFFRSIRWSKQKEAHRTATFLQTRGKRVVEDILTRQVRPADKCVPPSQEGLYEVPRSVVVDGTNIQEASSLFSFPVVGKILESSMGQGVRLLETPDALRVFIQDAGTKVLVQEYHPITYDTRVFVVGGEVLGGFNRYKKKGESFLTTTSGGPRERATLTAAQVAAAREAARLQGIEIAGVDMFMSEGRIMIIEVNESPQFRVFEKVTGVNAACRIIEHISS